MYKKVTLGQSLLEVVLSIGIASIVLAALVVMGASSIKTINSSLRRSEATKLSVSGIEAMRYYRDINGFGGMGGCYEIIESNITALGPCGTDSWREVLDSSQVGEDDYFERQIMVEDHPVGASPVTMKKVSSRVRWFETSGSSGDGYKEVTITTLLSAW